MRNIKWSLVMFDLDSFKGRCCARITSDPHRYINISFFFCYRIKHHVAQFNINSFGTRYLC